MKQYPGSGTLLLEHAAKVSAGFLRQYRVPFFSSLLFGLLAYGFWFTNKLVNHDEVSSLFTKGGTVSSGRWGLGALDSILPNYSTPWIYGILTIFLMALAVCFMVRMFCVQNKALQALTAGCVVVFPSLIGLFGYMFTSAAFALAFLLAVTAAALVQDLRKWLILPALGCLILSLSIYQSYISIAASLLVLSLIRQLLKGEAPEKILLKGICYVVFLVAALGSYYLGTQIILKVTGNELNSYASGNLAFSVSSVVQGTVLAYRNFFRFFTESFEGLIPTAFSRLLHWILMASIAALLLIQLFRKKNIPFAASGLLVLLIAMLPLAINCMYMITTPDSIHTLVLYGFVAVYLLAVILADRFVSEPVPFSGLVLNALTGTMALVIAVNIYVANQASLHLHLRYENASAFYTSLIADIKMNPGFDKGTKLAVIGEYQQPDYYTDKFEWLHNITGVYGFVPDSYSKNYFLEYYTGFPMDFATEEEIARITASAEFEAMAVYPYYGSLQKIGNILVVKLS